MGLPTISCFRSCDMRLPDATATAEGIPNMKMSCWPQDIPRRVKLDSWT